MSSISSIIKSIQKIMRQDVGVDGDAQRIGQLTWMLFLKIFDDREHEVELLEDDYRSPIPEEMRWRNWAADTEGMTGDELLEFINSQLFPTLKELSTTSPGRGRAKVVGDVFGDAYNYMKNGTLIRQVVNKINEINFNRSADRHDFGDMYEQILKDLQSAGNAGEYYTPRAVTQFMVDIINPRLGEVVLDPACGTGGFLTCAIEHVRANDVQDPDGNVLLESTIRGVEKKPLPHLLCTTNMLLHGIDVPTNVKHDNTLARPLRDYKSADRVNVILTNPPFGGTEEPGLENNFPATYRTRETADLFLLLIVHLLKRNGRGAVVLPEGTHSIEGARSRINEHFLNTCDVHTIVKLPRGVFSPYSQVRTNVLFFEKGRKTEGVWYYEHRYPSGYKNYSKTKPIKIEEFEAEKEWWPREHRDSSDIAWYVPIADIRDDNFNLDRSNPNGSPDDHPDPADLMAERAELFSRLTQVSSSLQEEIAAAVWGGFDVG